MYLTPHITFYCYLFLIWTSISFSEVSKSSIESALLISLHDLEKSTSTTKERRSWDENVVEQKRTELGDEQLLDTNIAYNQSSFSASHGNIIPESDELTKLLTDVFDNDVSEEDLQSALNYLVNNNLSLTRESLLAAIKSVLTAYYTAAPQSNNVNLSDSLDRIPYMLLRTILPKASSFGGNGATWIRDLAQLSMESAVEYNQPSELLNRLASAFSRETFLIVKDPVAFFNDRDSMSPEGAKLNPTANTTVVEEPSLLLEELDIRPGLSDIDPVRNVENPDMEYGGLSGFDPAKTRVFQELSIGLTQGFFNIKGKNNSLEIKHFNEFSKGDEEPGPSNQGNIEESIVSSYLDGFLDQVHLTSAQVDGQPGSNGISLYAYNIIKAASNGFLLASSVAASSSDVYLDNGLHLESAEILARGLSQSAILHSLVDPESNEASWTVDLLNAGRMAESIAHGAAMGSQLAMVQPRSIDFGDNYEVFTNSRREIAKSVARGVANGSVNASSWLNSSSAGEEETEPIVTAAEIEEVSRGAALGAMIGNTGLAVYYPTNQLVPIINFTAQGSSYGSTSSSNLSKVENEGTETIDVSITRESALGSAMGAAFEPAVLLDLRPDLRSRDAQTISHLEAASFGSTYGAILGIQANPTPPIPNKKLGTGQDDRVVELKQSAKQGSIEGALSGSQLALGIEDTSQESLQSKGEILKAINKSNAKAASNSNQNSSLNTLRTNSRDMLLLMKKFGINPRFTNPAKIYKRPVVVQVDEPPIDEELEEAFKDASPL
jgi:hypothetical protein